MDLGRILNPTSRSPRLTASSATTPHISPNLDADTEENPLSPRKRRRSLSHAGSQREEQQADDAAFHPRTPRKCRKRLAGSSPEAHGISKPDLRLPGTRLWRRSADNSDRGSCADEHFLPAFSSSPPSVPSTPSDIDPDRFSIFNAILTDEELMFEFTKQLPVDDLVALYAISRDFHTLANRRLTALILGQSVTKAPESSRIFIHRCYKNLCIQDPAGRPNESVPGEVRWVPSFRWLRMVLFREKVVDDIMAALAYCGHRLPPRASLVIKKLWFTLDIPDNRRRIYLFHNTTFWTSTDLFIFHIFLVKLDMRLNNPVKGFFVNSGFREMLLNQRSLSTLCRVLKRERVRHQLDVMEMFAAYKYRHPRVPRMTMFSGKLQPHQVGKLCYEGWGLGHTKFVPVENMAMREAVRRRLDMPNHYYDMMLFGYIDRDTWTDIVTQKAPDGFFKQRRVKTVDEIRELKSDIDADEDTEGDEEGTDDDDDDEEIEGQDEREYSRRFAGEGESESTDEYGDGYNDHEALRGLDFGEDSDNEDEMEDEFARRRR